MPLNPQNPLVIGLAFLAVWLLMVVLLRPHGDNTLVIKPVATRGSRPRGPVYIPLTLGKVTIDLQPTMTETVHVVIGGSTRTGKSTSVLPLFDLDIGVLCIALDITVPIEAKVRAVGGIVWTNDPDECRIGLDILDGPARIASEGLVAGFPKSQGNVGDYQRSARDVIWSAMDHMGSDRNLPDIILALLKPMPDTEAGRACRSWARKLANLYRIIGPTLGSDLDVVQAMRDRQKVLLKLNHFLSPDDSPFLAGMLLVLARRVMEQAGVPFVLIVEEAGQAAIAQGHLAPIAQAGAARGAPTVILTQNLSTLPLEVRNNLAVTVSFAQEDVTEQRAAAARLELIPEQLRRSAFPDKGVGWCYVRAPGLPTTRVRIKQQKLKGVSVAEPLIPAFTDTPVRTPRWVIQEVDGGHDDYLGLPSPSEAVTTLLANVYPAGGCERWRGKHDRAGHRKDCAKNCADQKHVDGCYGLVWWEGKWQRVHRVRWALQNGPIGVDDDGVPLTVDHRRTCYRDCSALAHLDLCSGPENSRRRWRVRGVGSAVGD